MKTSILLAAGSLMGAASAGVHKMKLKKVPLSEQLVSLPCYHDDSLWREFKLDRTSAS